MRLDKWLWAARLYRTRALAAAAADGGKVEVNGRGAKRARDIAPGDEIRLKKGPFEYRLHVRALSERRGPAREAAALYEEDPAVRQARDRLAAQLRATPTAFHAGKGKPSKKQRRELARFKRKLALLPLLLLPASLPAQQAPIPVDTAIRSGRLPNGIRYFIRANTRPENRAELRLVVEAGSVLEDADQLGLAHFTEHMAFNGTERFARQQLVNYLESIGMRLGPDLNAYTSFDETVYMLQVPTDTAAVVETAVRILADWAHGVTFDSAEVEKERGVVIEEWRLGRGAAARIRDQQFPVLFEGSRYAERLPIGRRDVLETFDHAALRRFYATWYRPDLMTVIAVGDFTPERIEALIRREFAAIPPAAPDAPPRPRFEVPDRTEPAFAVATDPEATSSSVAVLFLQPPREHTTVAAFRQQIVERLFLRMLNARLFERAQEADPPFLGAGAGQGRFIGAKEFFQMGAGVRAGGIARGLAALLTEAERVQRHGFTAGELERARAQLLRGMERAWEEREKTESRVYAAELIRHVLAGEPVPGVDWELARYREFLPTVTLDEVDRLAGAWITDYNRVVLADAPARDDAGVPAVDSLERVFTAAVAGPVAAYEDALTDAPLVAAPPAPSPVVADSSIPDVGFTIWTLGNGVRVILKPTDFKADEILFRASSPGGYSLASEDEWVSAYYADWILSASGAGPFSAVDLQKQLAGKAISVGPMILELEEGFSGSASPRDLETALQVLYLYFTAPRRDSAAFAATRQRLFAMYEDRSASPDAAFFDTLRVTLSQYHPRYLPPSTEQLDALSLDQALAFYRDRYADASDFTFIFVGNFTPDSIRPLIERWVGGLPAHGREETWRDLGVDPPTGVIRKTVRRGLEDKGRTQIVFTGPWDDSREARHDLRSLGEALQLRLRDVLREDLGGTYGVGVSATSSIRPDAEYAVRVSFGADPARLDELTAVVFDEIRAFQEAGPADSIVRKVQEAQRRSRETALRENRYWLGQIWASLEYDVDWANFLTGYERLIDGLTAETLRDAARRWLRTDNYVQVSLVPEGSPIP